MLLSTFYTYIKCCSQRLIIIPVRMHTKGSIANNILKNIICDFFLYINILNIYDLRVVKRTNIGNILIVCMTV